MLNETPAAGAPVVFVNVTVRSREDSGVNVCTPSGVDAVATEETVSGATPYPALTMLA
jgi:hypothetical protein